MSKLPEALKFATTMARQWDDEVLLRKTPADVMRSYGCTKDDAERVLNTEKKRRHLC